MSQQRLSLSSDVLARRIKKYDSYRHNENTSLRKDITPEPRHVTPNRPPNLISKKPNAINTKTNPPKDNGLQRLALSVVARTPASSKAIFDDQPHGFSSSAGDSIKKKRTKKQITLHLVTAIVFLFAVGTSLQSFMTNRRAAEVLGQQTGSRNTEGVTEGDGNNPSEQVVSAEEFAAYQVNPQLPRYLRIPSLGVSSRIKHTGIKKGAIDAPWNIYDTSWFNESAVPGADAGTSLILGHVSGWSGPGVFKNISSMKAGDRFEIEKGSGEKVVYEVTRSQQLALADVNMAKILGSEVAGRHEMRLMTCTGAYNSQTETYESRFVVYAKIVR